MEDTQLLDIKKYFKKDGDPGFSPERNRQVIENSIKKYEAKRARQMREYHEQIDERSQAVYQYLKAVDRGMISNVDKYFGKKWMGYLRGRQILETIMTASGNGKKQKIIKLDDVRNY